MLCPFCLEDVTFKKEARERGTFIYVCSSPDCAQPVPRLYVDEYRAYPPVVVSVIGHRAHGKTVALSTLYYTLSRLNLGDRWPGFYLFPINESSLEVVFENARMLEQGLLPPPNPKIFPEPTLIQMNGLPLVDRGQATLLFYDTAGEAFLRTQDIGRYAGFVRRARTVLFLVSLPRLRRTARTEAASPAGELERLLFSYIQGMADMNAATQNQHLIIVYTCADTLIPDTADWPDIQHYIQDDDWGALADIEPYVARMHHISARLRAFTGDALGARQFLTLAGDRFASVNFSIISALGSAPDEHGRLDVRIKPTRILDPLLWMLERQLPPRKHRRLMRLATRNHGLAPQRRRSSIFSFFR